MIWLDYVIIGIIIISALVSLMHGLIREALSLITWICACFIAKNYYSYLTIYFTRIEEQIIRISIAMTILFITTLIVGAMINEIMKSLVIRSGLSSTDRLLGMVFGALRGCLIVSAILFLCDSFTNFSHNQEWQQSQLIPQFSNMIRWFLNYLNNTSTFLPRHYIQTMLFK